MITLTQLEYIVAIDEYRHFATAAEKCFVTQPTLSMQVRKLEDELGVIIFDRTRQPVVPTDIGSKLISQARLTLASSERMKEIINEDSQEISGHLRIGIIPTLSPYLLPLFMGSYVRKYPKVNVVVEELVSEDIIRKLKHDQLDVGILVTPYNDEKILEKPIFYEEILLYAHPNNTLLLHDSIDIKNIDANQIWLLGDGHCFRRQVLNICSSTEKIEKHLPFVFESSSLETLMRIVDTEGGLTLIPELAVKYMPERKFQQIRHFSPQRPLREVSLVYSRYYTKRALVQLLYEGIKTCIPSEMLDQTRGSIIEWKCKMN